MTTTQGNGTVWSNVSIDRIDSKLGYLDGNIQLTCVAPNKMKREMPQDEFVEWCRLVVSHADGLRMIR